MLDPRFKIEWFKQKRWGQSIADDYEKLFKATFERYRIVSKESRSKLSRVETDALGYEELVFGRKTVVTNECEDYLNSPLASHTADPLGWWRNCKLQYPTIAKMALDYLAIPDKLYLFHSSFELNLN